MFKLIGDLKQLPQAAEDVLSEGDPVVVFAVNDKGEARAYRTSKAQCAGVKDVGPAPTDSAALIQWLNGELANQPDCTKVKTAPKLLKGEKGEILAATLEGSPGCYWILIDGSYVWVCV